MRKILLASVTSAALAAAFPAFAQSIGASASNIDKADTRSEIAPSLPVPPASADAGPRQFVEIAHTALQEHRTGEAQEALERAETRALDVSHDPMAPGASEASGMIQAITDAREALGRGDMADANKQVEAALAVRGSNQSAMTQPAAAPMPANTQAMAKPSNPAPAISSNAALPWQTGTQAWTFSGNSYNAQQTATGSTGVQTTYTQ